MSVPGPTRRPVYLLNPGAREGRAAARLRAVLAAAPAWAAAGRVIPTASLADAERAIASLADDELPVAAGGDGTVNLAARALRAAGAAGLALGILPLGTGNAIAHALGIPDPARAFAALAGGEVVALDVLATTHPGAPLALCSISTGFEGVLLAGLDGRRGARRAGGLLGALPAALGRRSGIALEVDAAALADPGEQVFNAGLYNLPRYAFGLRVHPDALGTDGRADAVVHARGGTWIRALLRGQPTAVPCGGAVRASRAERARLCTRWPIQVDGESVAPGELDVRVEPRGLRLIVPGAATPGSPSPG